MQINRYRGDNKPFKFTFYSDKTNNIKMDITGLSFKMTINSEKDPVDTTNQKFQLVGVITGPAIDGVVWFSPSKVNMDLPKGKYYYDIQITDGDGCDDTPMKDILNISQDLTKS